MFMIRQGRGNIAKDLNVRERTRTWTLLRDQGRIDENGRGDDIRIGSMWRRAVTGYSIQHTSGWVNPFCRVLTTTRVKLELGEAFPFPEMVW